MSFCMPQIMPTRERILLIAQNSTSMINFRENMETLSVGDNLGHDMYILSVMLGGIEESEYVLPDPDIEHLTWVFHQTVRSMLEMVVKDPQQGLSDALGFYKEMR